MIMRLVGIFGQLRTTDCCRYPEGEDELSRILKKGGDTLTSCHAKY